MIRGLSVQPKIEVLNTPDRLESWKAIAAYLGRSERTVRRWEEKEELPVHRLQHDKRGSVYAYARELDAWRESRRQLVEVEANPLDEATAARTRRWMWAGTACLAVGLSTVVWTTLDSAPPAPRPEVVTMVERGRSFAANLGRVQLQTAIATFQEAIRLDPGYAPAWSALATAHVALMWFGEDRVTDLAAQARREAREALRLDPDLSGPWQTLGFVSHYVEYDHSEAAGFFRRAIAADPANAVALSWFGDFHISLRRYGEALEFYRRAQEAAPRWLEPLTFAANVQYFSGHSALAIAEYDKVLAIQPGYSFANHFRGRALLAAGRLHEAVAQLRTSDELFGHVPFSRADLGYALAVSGAGEEAESILAGMVATREAGYYPAFALSVVHLGLGRSNEALEFLARAVDERHVGFYLPSADPFFDAVRTDGRFKALLARMNLPL